jgi:DNA-binding transcriptional LysR family regulator
LRLTQVGADLLPVAKRAIADIEGMIEYSRELGSLRRGRVAIASGTVQAALLLPGLIRTFSERYPEVSIAMHDVAEKVVIDMVLGDAVDFGLGTIPEGDSEIVGTRLITEEFLIVMRPEDPLVKRKELRWNDLAGLPLIGPQRGNPIRERLEGELARKGIVLALHRTMREVSLPLTIIGMVEGGLGVAIMTGAVTRLATSMGLVTRTPLDPVVTREVSLIQRRDRSLSPAARQLRDFLLRSCR